jgi:hypothetical protein
MLELLRQRWNSKTYRAGLIMTILSVIEVQSGFFSQFLPEKYRPALIAAWPLAMFFMREITTTALADK